MYFRSLHNPQAGFSYLVYTEHRLKEEETSREYDKQQRTASRTEPSENSADHSRSSIGLD